MLQQGQRIFLSIPKRSDGFETHQASYSVGTGGSFPGGVKRQGRESNHLPHLVLRFRMHRATLALSHMASWRGS
jgi:hypothetical protein